MKKTDFYFALIFPLCLSMSHCAGKSSKNEEPQITKMDSVSQEMEKSNKELEDKSKKVEASLEKLDKELNN